MKGVVGLLDSVSKTLPTELLKFTDSHSSCGHLRVSASELASLKNNFD